MSEFAPHSEDELPTLHAILERSARSALDFQQQDGSFPAGRNYTYDEPETPVRTTAHWILTLSKVYDITGEDEFKQAANAAVDFLLGSEARPHSHTFHCRNASGKDKCNGLVGQSTPIEALIQAGDLLNRQDAIETAEEVFLLHPFDDQLGLWERVEINGEKISFDRTLNHQLLFAARSTKLATRSDIVTERINRFLTQLETNMRIHPDGLIKHYVRPVPRDTIKTVVQIPRHYEMLINELVFHYYSRSDERRRKERGYHTVNLSALSQLKQSFESHPLWQTEIINRSLAFLLENKMNIISKKDTKHGSILPGIETAKIVDSFIDSDTTQIAQLVSRDLCRYLNRDSYLLQSAELDKHNQMALISELTQLPNVRVEC